MRNIAKVSGNVQDIVFLEVGNRNQVFVKQRLREINPAKVAELADSIRVMGVLQPITVTKEGGHFTVVSGAHRWSAICKVWDEEGEEAGEFNIPARVIHVAEGDEEVVEIAENLHRNDLSKEQRKEMALMYLSLIGANGPAKDSGPASQMAQPQNQPAWFSICLVNRG